MWDERIRLTWMTDSGHRESVHRNAPGLSASDNYLGHLVYTRDSHDFNLGSWGYVTLAEPRKVIEAATYARARTGLEAAAMKLLSPRDEAP